MTDGRKRILVVNGHPDPDPSHLCAALADAYASGAEAAGFEVERMNIGALEFPLIRSLQDYQRSAVSPDMERAQASVKHTQHIVLAFPIWFGAPPAYLKGFFEQLLRSGFSLSTPEAATTSLLTGKSARLLVTMGVPAPAFRFLLGGHGVRSLERGLFWVAGVDPIRHSLFGRAHAASPAQRAAWLKQANALGRRGA